MKEEYLVDLESQKTLLSAINRSLHEQNKKLRQRSNIESKTISQTATKMQNRGIAMLIVTIIPVMFFVVYGMESLSGQVEPNYKTKYLLQGLQGDTVDTWVHWNVSDTERITVNIINADSVSEEKITAIKDAILSTETIDVEDYLLHKAPRGSSSTYYLGWQGAIFASSDSTAFPIPSEFVILESPRGEGDITIRLLNERDADGYTGYTKSTIDNGYILKSSITIYNADEISADEIGTITRHEFGHALGLGHSTATEDLMAPTITTMYPYISQCDIDAISALYDGKTSSEVTCTK